MRHVLAFAAVGVLALAADATAVLTPGRTIVAPSAVSAVSVTHRSVVYAVTENPSRTRCAYLELWDTTTKGLWRFGQSTTRVCREGPSTGSGIAAVSTSGRRVYWLTFVGGNLREYALWTATPSRRSPRRLAASSSDVDSGRQPIVLADGTRDGVAYAVGRTVTYVADSGARLFRARLDGDVRLLATGAGPGSARVVAVLDDGRIVTLSDRGRVLATAPYAQGEVGAVRLALPGPIVQAGLRVEVGSRTLSLPPRAHLLDFRQGRVVYATGGQVRSRQVATGADVLLQTIPVRSWQRPLFSTDAWGSGWARGRTVSWRSGPLG